MSDWMVDQMDNDLARMAKEAAWQDFVETQMGKYKDEAVKMFCVISKPMYAEMIATTIAFGFREDLTEAIAIVEDVRLDDKHIAALTNDLKWMEKLLEEDKTPDWLYNEWEDHLYDSINY